MEFPLARTVWVLKLMVTDLPVDRGCPAAAPSDKVRFCTWPPRLPAFAALLLWMSVLDEANTLLLHSAALIAPIVRVLIVTLNAPAARSAPEASVRTN